MITPLQQEILLDLAAASIRHGLEQGCPLKVEPGAYEEPLRALAATFVTLNIDDRLRGCIGRLEAERALVEDVADNAFAAAFRDPRFSPLTAGEFEQVAIHISVLTPPERLIIASEAQLLDLLEAGRDGLIIEDRGHRATFLPSVWTSLGQKEDFLRQLKLKAGLPAEHWSPDLRAYRYRAVSFP